MNIYAFIPLIATIAYVPLLVTTISARPWRTQQKWFLLFLFAAIGWSLADLIFRYDFFPGQRKVLGQIIFSFLSLAAVQLHVFSSSFYPPGKGRWLGFAYGSMIAILVIIGLGFIPKEVVTDGDKLLPVYGFWVIIIALPLLVLLTRNLFIFIPGIKNQENPVKRNQYISLVMCAAVLAFFLAAAALPYAKEFPLSHIGNIFIAIILSYAVVGQHLVDIRFVLRRSVIWLSIGVIGIAAFWSILVIYNEFVSIGLNLSMLFAVTIAGIFALVLVYRLRDLVARFLGKAFQGDSYHYREKLFEFANKIHNVFSLKQQGRELLALITGAVGCRRAFLLFADADEDYDAQITESVDKDSSVKPFRLRGDNPIIGYLKREKRPLTREILAIEPEFLGLWQQEKDALDANQIELLMPLISRDRLIGILALDDKKTGRYNLEDYNLLEDIIQRVAVSMEKEFLREQLKEREEELSVINRSNAIITSSLDIQRIYANFIQELKRVVDVDWAAIAVIEDKEIYFMALSTEIGSPWKAGERMPLKGSGTEWVAVHSKPIIDQDMSIEMRFTSGKYYIQHGIHSIAYLPLLISNQVIGTLIVASRKPNAYTPRHSKLLEQLASQIAMPIENARLYAMSERLARVDSLTGVLNRRSLDETLPSEIGRHSRYGGVFSLIILDIDSLKTVNDNYGHLAGDELLRQVSTIITGAIRESDRAFRYGGDEFAILLPQTSIESALKVAERIRQQAFARIEIGSIPISTSLGISSWPVDGVSPNAVLAAADAALYQAKRAGRNRTICASPKLNLLQKQQADNIIINRDVESLSTIFALSETTDSRDRLSGNHSKRVHDFAIAIGDELGLDALEINRLGTCALLHDIGKIGINDEILNKKEPLTSEEWNIIKGHAKLGASIVSHSSQLAPCVQGILHHHERYNGEGYPDGLKGDEIPLESRILAIADSFATMTRDRIYSRALTFDGAIQEIINGAGTQFDPKIVNVFLKVISKPSLIPEETKTGRVENGYQG
jgi:diguanylate cyclase (GGDEF)-like protein/putative nucleotidyltransferase with HDIG domain